MATTKNFANAAIKNATFSVQPLTESTLLSGIIDRRAIGGLGSRASQGSIGQQSQPQPQQQQPQQQPPAATTAGVSPIQLLVSSIPTAAPGGVISSEHHNALRTALMAIASQLGLGPLAAEGAVTFS